MIVKCVNGLTISQLKDLLKNFPDKDPDTGEDCTVWIGEGFHSNDVYEVSTLNVRQASDGSYFSDILLSIKEA